MPKDLPPFVEEVIFFLYKAGLPSKEDRRGEEIALGLIISSILMVSGVSAESTGLSQDEMAIRKAVESYVDAYNRADASAIASHWSRNGSYLTVTGEYVKGPDKIRPALEKLFSERKGVKVKVALFDVQLQSSDRAITKGFAVFERPGEEK